MKMSEGVEWTAHACALLAALPPGVGLPANALAEFHALAPAYMAKHMQALARAGVVESVRGAARRLSPRACGLRPSRSGTSSKPSKAKSPPSAVQRNPPAGPVRHARKATSADPCEIHAAFNRAETGLARRTSNR